MKSRMTTAKILAMGDKEVGDMKKPLLNRAKFVENNSPEPRHTIHMWDMMLAIKEKERLGLNFNRSVTMSLESRWEVVNKLTVEFLKEVISLNDQLSEEAGKQAKHLMTVILTRTKRLGIASRMEQMAGLLMHITFYRTVLKAKVEEMQEVTSFLFRCAELMGFTHPTQIMDRYTTLQATLNEIRENYELRVSYLTKLQDNHAELLESGEKKKIVLHNKMANLHLRLKDLHNEISEMERFIEEKEMQAADSVVKLKKIKASINHCYTSIMTYKGLECRETNIVKQMEEFGIRLANTMAAIKFVEDQQARASGESDARESVRRTVCRISKDTGLSDSVFTEENCDMETVEGATLENKSSNWRSCMVGSYAAAPMLVSRACVEPARQRIGTMPSKNEDPGIDVRKYTLFADLSLMSCVGGEQTNGSLEESRRTEQPFPSAGASLYVWRCQRREVFPSRRSFSIGESETIERRKSHGLDTIHETGCLGTKRANSMLSEVIPQISSQQRTGVKHGKVHEGNRWFSHRAQCLPSPTPKGDVSNTSLDKSSNKSLLDCKIDISKSGTTNALKQLTRDRDFLQSITPDSRQVKRPVSPRCCQHGRSDTKSGMNLVPLSRMSDRIRNQMSSDQRLYYLSPSPVQQMNTRCNGFWDDGVFVSAPRVNNKKSKLKMKRIAAVVKEERANKDPKPDLKFEAKRGRKVDSCRISTTQNSFFPVTLKAAVKRLSYLSGSVSKKDIDFLQRTVSKSSEVYDSQTSKESQSRLFGNRISTDSVMSGRALSNCISESSLKLQTRKPPVTKTSSCGKIRNKNPSAPVNPHHPPLPRPSFLQQQRRHAVMAATSSFHGPVEGTHPSAPKSNALKLARKLYQTRNFKRDCLSILANVKLGSRWPEKHQQKD